MSFPEVKRATPDFKPRFRRVIDKVEVSESSGERILPDSEQLHGLCPHCQRQSNFEMTQKPIWLRTVIRKISGMSGSHEAVEHAVILRCRGCGSGTVVVEECREPVLENNEDAYMRRYWRAIFHYPFPAAKSSPDTPAHIASVYSEAVIAQSAQLPRAAAAMARATLDAITIDKGNSTINNLKRRLDDMAARGILQSDLAEWAHEVRLIGNESVHDATATVAMADVTQLINFLAELILALYVRPAELARRRATR